MSAEPRYRCMYCDAPAALGVRCPCQIDPRDTEIAALRRWKALHDAAPDGAKAIVIERMQEAAAIEPIVRAWREANVKLEAERDEARRDLAATQREADRLRHGLAIEGDYVCPNALRADGLREQVAQALALLDDISATDVHTAAFGIAAVSDILRRGATKEGTP